MPIGTFVADVKRFAKLTEKSMRRVAMESIQDVMERAQTSAQGKTAGGQIIEGRIPVVSADLINSLAVETNGVLGGEGPDSYITAIVGMKLGDTLRFGWTVEYAARVHSGFIGTDSLGRSYNQQGWHWITPHAARWPLIVRRNITRYGRAK